MSNVVAILCFYYHLHTQYLKGKYFLKIETMVYVDN